MQTINRKILFATGCVIILALFLGGLYIRQPREYFSEEFLMDTLVSISTYGADTDLLQQATREAFSAMRQIAEKTDRYARHKDPLHTINEIDRINDSAAIAPVKVDADVFAMIKSARDYYDLTNGAFDITIAPLIDLWGFGTEEPRLPSPEALTKTLSLVDASSILLDEAEQTVYFLKPGMALDLGAVAKGYAVEKAAQILSAHGIKKALINAGGNIRVLGERTANDPWRVGIQDPRDPSGILGILNLNAEAATTSGDYNRTFSIDGQTYHHILSKKDGYPASGTISVTVVTKDAFSGDLLSTALFLLEPEAARKLAESMPDTEALIVTSAKKILMTSGLQQKFESTGTEGYSYD